MTRQRQIDPWFSALVMYLAFLLVMLLVASLTPGCATKRPSPPPTPDRAYPHEAIVDPVTERTPTPKVHP